MEYSLYQIQSLDDVRRLIKDQIEECPTLEYKSGLGSNNEIAKDISALANTLGGTLVYGVLDADRVPIQFSWLSEQGLEERIQNVARTLIKPQLKEVAVDRYPPGDVSQFVLVVQVPASPEGPHMVHHRYYKRQGSESVPMEDHEVKLTMFRRGLKTGLLSEIRQNSVLAQQTLSLIDGIYAIADPGKRRLIAFIPFHEDAWKALLASGLLISVDPPLIDNLIQAYALIHEVNSLIEWLKVDNPPVVHTPADASSVPNGKYLSAIVKEKVSKLLGVLKTVENSIGGT